MNYLLAAADAAPADGTGAFISFLILFGFLYAIYAALTKKKAYDVRLGGTIKQR